MTRNIDAVIKEAIRHFRQILHPQAVRIFTPFAQRMPLASHKLSPALAELLGRYERKAVRDGLFPHQGNFLDAHLEGGAQNFILTTATGTGKSLCFWMWVFHHLLKDPNATALLCFPTQALAWSQAERLVHISECESLAYPGRQTTLPMVVRSRWVAKLLAGLFGTASVAAIIVTH
jgi:DEAD/DEAH box helicase